MLLGDIVRGYRHKPVFPPGFDGSASSRGTSGHYSHSTEQLYIALVDSYSPMAGAELITVKSAWYGRQTDPGEHEFIIFQVEDARDEELGEKGLVNYIVLDRTVVNKPTRSVKAVIQLQNLFQDEKAADTFRVSYDGDVFKLLSDCGLHPNVLIERLRFPPDKPLHLYEVVAIADVVSSKYPDYRIVDANDRIFARLVWGNLIKLYPTTTYRSKYDWLRSATNESQIEETYEQASHRISQARLKIETQKAQLEKLIQSRLIAMGRAMVAPAKGPVSLP